MIKVGCCGFGVARSKYFQEFSLVEIQQTFYQPPRQKCRAKRWSVSEAAGRLLLILNLR